jgi:hypothetical protein
VIQVTVPHDVAIRGYVVLRNAPATRRTGPASDFVRRAAARATADHPHVEDFHRAMRERTEKARAARVRR